MATGQSGSNAANRPLSPSLALSSFCEYISSPNWLYPTARFFGHALYEYYYDIDFMDCAGQKEILKRNKILYESYCDLVGSLMVTFCKEYHIPPVKLIEVILKMNSTMVPNIINENIFNLMRASFGMDHFGYVIMSYCNIYKVKCCEDIAKYISKIKVADSKKQNWEQLWRYLHEVMKTTAEEQLKVETFFSYRMKVTDAVKAGPFISCYGISMYDPSYEYGARLDRMMSLISKASFAKLKIEEFTDPVDTRVNRRDDNRPESDISKMVETTKANTLEVGNEFPSGLGSGLIPTLKVCLGKREEEDTQKNKSPCSSSTRKPQIESKSTKACLPQQHVSVSPSSTKVKSNLSSESSQKSTASGSEAKGKSHSPKVVAHNAPPSTSTFDYDLFMKTLPTSKKIREEYLLYEYDCRLKTQIAYQAANFELQDAIAANRQFRALICEQKRFERNWPLLRKKSKEMKESQTLHDESIAGTAKDEKEACFIELIKEGRAIIEIIQYGVYLDITDT